MGQVISHMTMSLDGFIADPGDGIDELFGWYGAGPVEIPTANADVSFRVDENSAEVLRTMLATTGALVCGRRLFDLTTGWGDNHPVGTPVVVVTHHPPEDAGRWKTMSFAPSVEAAVVRARDIAGDRNVVVSSADIAGQALDLGLLDEVHVSLVPVIMGEGIRHFDHLTKAPHRFSDPVVVAGTRALHLRYPVRREA